MTSGSIPKAVEEQVRLEAENRCGYCHTQQSLLPAPLEVEHITPRAKGGTDDQENLWLACRLCNVYKSDQVAAIDPQTNERVSLFDPRRQTWTQHFQWSTDGRLILGLSDCGRATVAALNLNNAYAVTARGNWVRAGWHPPADDLNPAQSERSS